MLFENVKGSVGILPDENAEPISDSLIAKLRTDVNLPTSGDFKAAAWVDFDNDGHQDLCLARSDTTFLFVNEGDDVCLGTVNYNSRHFRKVSIAPGVSPATGGALAWGDYDADGDLDLFLSGADGQCHLYRNNIRSDATEVTRSNYLHVDLVGTRSNRAAIGAKVRITTSIPTLPTPQFREVEGGSGYSSFNSLTVEFGLGSATSASKLEIAWPSGKTETITPTGGIAANQHLIRYEPVNVTASVTIDSTYPDPAKRNRGAVCPQGDGLPLVARLQFNDPLPFRTVAASEITLGLPPAGPPGHAVLVYPEDGSCQPNSSRLVADHSARAETQPPYTTRITKYRIGGCGEVTLPIYWNGVEIATVTADVVSPDVISSGHVDGSDLGRFASALGIPAHYDPCVDFIYSGAVDGSDLGLFATHYTHSCANSASKASFATVQQRGPANSPPMHGLAQNVPNPFNLATRIGYSVAQASQTHLFITDVQGRRVRTLVRANQIPGDYVAIWDGQDDRGHAVASGVYFYHLESSGRAESKRMVLVR